MLLRSASSAPAYRSASSPYLPAFTGVRAVAAYLVFLHHFNPFQGQPQLTGLKCLVMEFHVGVPVFFVLSGFLITLRYGAVPLTQPRVWWRYMRNRVARIYPIYFLLTLLTYAAFWQQGHFFTRDLVLSLTLTHALFDTSKYVGIAQAWSLTVEECFYLLAPLLFWLLRRPRPRLWLQPFGLLMLGCGLVIMGQFLAGPLTGFFGSFRFMLLFTLFGRCIEFYAGIQLALLYRQGWVRATRWPYVFTVAGIGIGVACVMGMALIKGGYTYGQEHPLGVVLNNVALPGGILLVFIGLLTENTWLRRLLATQLFQVLGKSSYAFYLIHMGVVHDWLAAHVTPNNLLLFILLNVVAIGLHYGVEEPLNRRLRAAPAFSPTV